MLPFWCHFICSSFQSPLKKFKFSPDIPDWEMRTCFDPLGALNRQRKSISWMTLGGTDPQPQVLWPRAEDVLSGLVQTPNFKLLPIRDPNLFVAGQLKENWREWDILLEGKSDKTQIMGWIKDGVDVEAFFRPFNGNFGGKSYGNNCPPFFYQKNSRSCQENPTLVAKQSRKGLLMDL